MKKIFFCLLLITAMLLCSCEMTESELIQKAEDIILNSETYNNYFISFNVQCSHNSGKDYLATGITIADFRDRSEYYAGVEASIADKIRADIYPKLEKLVEDTKYGTMFAVRTLDGRYVCTYVNGEYVNLD